ncbi:hypothetical protein GCM10012275_29620 [Longimycelium tulufanense]|uniref:Uncharacterized protein n=1 Tax=Longimycelium tulufanense TaxID=907463 RepID=A0A8J3CEF9_9PSEU|nr:hypothetical protein [Longimycelium tulufanense]GGM56554.1 hypothetical protein GCM10012275_29620 [Longimycelium tulufanense]
MSAKTATAPEEDTASDTAGVTASLPTALCSVVWSGGHPYVREGHNGRARWVGLDDRGRPLTLTDAELARRGWSRRASG